MKQEKWIDNVTKIQELKGTESDSLFTRAYAKLLEQLYPKDEVSRQGERAVKTIYDTILGHGSGQRKNKAPREESRKRRKKQKVVSAAIVPVQ
jgi:hypothetical protein